MIPRTISKTKGALGALFLVACAESHAPPQADAARADAAILDPSVFDAALFDAGPPSLFPITDEQADCLGLSRPQCAPCHSRPDGFYLRPSAGAPPAGVDPDALPWEACGVVRP